MYSELNPNFGPARTYLDLNRSIFVMFVHLVIEWFNYPSSFPTSQRNLMKVKPIKPDFLLRDVEDLTEYFEELYYSLGLRGILYDLERTLVPIGEKVIPAQRVHFLRFMERKGFVQGLCTNSSKRYTGVACPSNIDGWRQVAVRHQPSRSSRYEDSIGQPNARARCLGRVFGLPTHPRKVSPAPAWHPTPIIQED